MAKIREIDHMAKIREIDVAKVRQLYVKKEEIFMVQI